MGISGSKDNEGDFCTPPKIGTHRRIIDHDLDPRSPSTAISRTPIVVDKTPEGLLDPRSPTVGISRTPITSLSGNHGKQNYNDINLLMSSFHICLIRKIRNHCLLDMLDLLCHIKYEIKSSMTEPLGNEKDWAINLK